MSIFFQFLTLSAYHFYGTLLILFILIISLFVFIYKKWMNKNVHTKIIFFCTLLLWILIPIVLILNVLGHLSVLPSKSYESELIQVSLSIDADDIQNFHSFIQKNNQIYLDTGSTLSIPFYSYSFTGHSVQLQFKNYEDLEYYEEVEYTLLTTEQKEELLIAERIIGDLKRSEIFFAVVTDRERTWKSQSGNPFKMTVYLADGTSMEEYKQFISEYPMLEETSIYVADKYYYYVTVPKNREKYWVKEFNKQPFVLEAKRVPLQVGY